MLQRLSIVREFQWTILSASLLALRVFIYATPHNSWETLELGCPSNSLTSRTLYISFTAFIYTIMRVSVKRGPDTCGWRMRMGKCGWKKMRTTKKVRRKKREMRMAKKKKINKQTNKGKKSFFQVAVTWLDPSLTYRT